MRCEKLKNLYREVLWCSCWGPKDFTGFRIVLCFPTWGSSTRWGYVIGPHTWPLACALFSCQNHHFPTYSPIKKANLFAPSLCSKVEFFHFALHGRDSPLRIPALGRDHVLCSFRGLSPFSFLTPHPSQLYFHRMLMDGQWKPWVWAYRSQQLLTFVFPARFPVSLLITALVPVAAGVGMW